MSEPLIETHKYGEHGKVLKKNLIPDLEERLIIDVEEELELLKEVLTECKIAVPWMVKSLALGYEDEGIFSDELKHAIAVKELLEKI